MLPQNRATDSMVFTDNTVAEVLAGKHPPERKPYCSALEAHKEMSIFVLVDIMEDMVESVA